MNQGVTVYAPDGITEVFNSSTRTFKKIAQIPFSRKLRKTTTYITNPLFATETPVWFFTLGALPTSLISFSVTGDTAKLVVDTFYRSSDRGNTYYENTIDPPWEAWDKHFIILGVY